MRKSKVQYINRQNRWVTVDEARGADVLGTVKTIDKEF
jgi:hypothetical protein